MIGREFRRRIGVGVLIVGGAVAMAGCSPITYGTGSSPMMQTVEGMVGVPGLFAGTQPTPTYQARPGLVTPPSGNLPVPGTGSTPANYPTNGPYTMGSSGETPPPSNLTAQQQTACAQAASLYQPPPQYCIPDPNAPAVTDPNPKGGFFKRLFGR